MTNLLGRAANKLKREFLRFGPVRVVAESAYLRALERHVPSLPPLDARDLSIVEALRHGTKIVPIDALEMPRTPAMLSALHTLVDALKNKPRNGTNAPRLPIDRLMDFPEIYTWGLDERLLALVENHIGLPVRYHGPDVRREIADGVTNDVRQWHIDAEDRRMFKIIVYLNDVEPGGGAFEYVDRVRTADVARALRYSSGFVKDAIMDTHTAPEERVECRAPAHTAIFVDTCKVFHRARAPKTRDRYSVTFSYTSTSQIKLYETIHLSQATRARVLAGLSERQRAVLP
jgi:hypothetical protein